MIKTKKISPTHYRSESGEAWVDIKLVAGKWEATYGDRAVTSTSFTAEFYSIRKAKAWAYDTLAEYA